MFYVAWLSIRPRASSALFATRYVRHGAKGGAFSIKTTLLNALSSCIPTAEAQHRGRGGTASAAAACRSAESPAQCRGASARFSGQSQNCQKNEWPGSRGIRA